MGGGRVRELLESCHGQWHVSEGQKEQGGEVGLQGLTVYAICTFRAVRALQR
jgi:hypothetical protein